MSGLQAGFEELLRALTDACRTSFGEKLVSVAVFGSVGRGTPRPDSDVDLLLVVEDLPTRRLARVEMFEPVEQALAPALRRLEAQGIRTELSPVLKTPQEVEFGSSLLLDMTEDARILWDRDGFLEGRLARLRQRLEELGSRRILYAGSWYWVLKPDLRPGEEIEL